MEIRLFPCPAVGVYTPFAPLASEKSYAAFVRRGTAFDSVRVHLASRQRVYWVSIATGDIVVDYRAPNRKRVLEFLGWRGRGCPELLKYCYETTVVPTFSDTIEEAVIKAIIRQVIRASQAKLLISRFIESFGVSDGGVYCFPSVADLSAVTVHQYRGIGLGMKAQRIRNVVDTGLELTRRDLSRVTGLGPWSRAVIQMDLTQDYRHYPFWDASGHRIRQRFGLDLHKIAMNDSVLAADLYVYAASCLESGS